MALPQLALPTPGVLHWRALLLALAQCTCRLWTEKIQFNSFLLMDIEGKIIVLNAKKPGGKGICVSFVQWRFSQSLCLVFLFLVMYFQFSLSVTEGRTP